MLITLCIKQCAYNSCCEIFIMSCRDLAEGGFDLFEDTIRDLFKTADTENKGHVTVDDFTKVNYHLPPTCLSDLCC